MARILEAPFAGVFLFLAAIVAIPATSAAQVTQGERDESEVLEEFLEDPRLDLSDERAVALVKRLGHQSADDEDSEIFATNIDFHKRLLRHPDFVSGDVDTGFVERLQSQ